jgi:NADPH-dependent 2,4-dienoyl-CoA reductase/sulfur reductase-like enzyme
MTTVLIIGAGPAGLAAADAALRAGAEVTLLDASSQPGGQFHRMLPTAYAATNPGRVQHGWRAFDRLRRRVLDHPRCTWWPETTVWAIEPGPRVHVVRGVVDGVGRVRYVLAPDALVLATGAHDRVLPFPGWQLPGVFTAGAAQAFAKGERVAIGERVVVAGSGPFLLPVTAALLEAGSRVLGVFEANAASTVARGWGSRPWQVASKAGELLGYAAALVRHRVPYRMGRTVIEARGAERVEEVVIARLRPDWSVVPGTERALAVDAVCVGHGFSPQVELAVAAGCELTGDGFVVVGEGQRTSVPGVYAAGEITGIAGAPAAAAEGAVAGWYAATAEPRDVAPGGVAQGGVVPGSPTLGDPALGGAVSSEVAAGGSAQADVVPSEVAPGGAGGRGGLGAAALRRVLRAKAFARRLARAHPIGGGWVGWLRPETIVCRCEETTYAALRDAVADPSMMDDRALRLATRAGLGPCQGRMCGATIAELTGSHPSHRRPIAQPVRLGELAEPPVSKED